VCGLWDSWDDDAFIRDRATGRYLGRQGGKEARDLVPAQPSAQNDFPASVDPGELENTLRDIDPDGPNLVPGWLLFW
jgi:hypothetical protein